MNRDVIVLLSWKITAAKGRMAVAPSRDPQPPPNIVMYLSTTTSEWSEDVFTLLGVGVLITVHWFVLPCAGRVFMLLTIVCEPRMGRVLHTRGACRDLQ